MRALALGGVIASRPQSFAERDLVHGASAVEEHTTSDGTGVYKIASGDGISLARHDATARRLTRDGSRADAADQE
jgi:NADPH-dependent curcumin reductase CurA